MKALSSSNTAHDEEESFFFSVIPAVRRVSEEEKLDFRMSALQLMKDINSRRKEMPVVFETTFSSASTSNIPNCNSTFFFSVSAVMDANKVNQLPHLLQADPECSSSSNVKTATASGYIFQSV